MGCVSLVPYDEEFACRQQMASILDNLRTVWDDIKSIIETAIKTVVDLWDKIRACIVPPRVLYLSKHGKTARVRKKNRKRIERIWKSILKGRMD